MSYPASFDTFVGTQAQGTTQLSTNDHALDHRQLGSAAANLQTTLGSTSGTNITKNFSAGDFPARINSSNVLQQALQGTINNSVIGTPAVTGGTVSAGVINNSTIGTSAITGGTANNQILGTPTFTLGLDAPQDIFYRSVAGTTNRLAAGVTGQILQTQGTSSAPQWANPSATYFSVPVNNGGFDRNAGTLYIGLTENGITTSEAIHQMNMAAGTFTELRIRVTNNSMDHAVLFALRRNGTTTALVGTITALTTGNFVGTASVGVAAGDLICLMFDSSTSTAAQHLDYQSLLTKFVSN